MRAWAAVALWVILASASARSVGSTTVSSKASLKKAGAECVWMQATTIWSAATPVAAVTPAFTRSQNSLSNIIESSTVRMNVSSFILNEHELI